ncbi:DUF2382 domain-containing protein [Leptolyngbya sp. KIOST-1]|uniref:DUF2382 domain-containing protein n=1 Tax=Leptolyngbya sp. KIOST-1 TaxID=1229172 RepID=UPI0018CD6EC0|nr:DUF2382 domain-containing protein [Leptolyngbya sp. KIOST-1]
MPEHQLINGSVFDRSGYLIGHVTRVDPLPQGNFSLAVCPTDRGRAGSEMSITNSQIKSIDAERKIVTVELDYPGHSQQRPLDTNPSDTNKTVHLVEERLVVNRRRVKVGEVSVRRVVETEVVEVPIRREKLVVETVGSGTPPVEVKLGEPRVLGNAFASDRSLDNSIDSRADALTASGNLTTIRDAISFLESATTLDNHCEKIRVYISLNQETGLKATVHQFESSEMAIQVLLGLETTLLRQCSSVRLELFLRDDSMLTPYRDQLARYGQPAPAEARPLSVER